ncbi:ABC transporter substrate-binding protein [Pseudarthrobacter sp. GA104]|uniref:ABC transporter substrate-binding protein n=1 Tax=Pseudarthrobacter sp. GA104 TaxID=2676311 RepID=UPI0012FA1341|nr:extracellular solute-binding protein [Pseudarthrobacter sp. GA104]MUU69719.1 extracellular solute-binding protein [Pseudarthrobacter sp. GA104]
MQTSAQPRFTHFARAAGACLAIATATVGLAACDSGAPVPPGGAAKNVTLVVPTSQAPWNPAYAKVVQEYQKETGNKVELRNFPNPDVKTQQVNDIQSQKHTFDVFQINEQDLAQFNVNGWVQPFNEVDPGYKPDEQIYSYSNVAKWDASKKVFDASGKITNLPLLGNVDIFVYRKDIYEKLGLNVPKTWEEVISNGKKIAEAQAAKYGGVFRTQGVPGTYSATFEFQPLLNSAGGAWFKEQGTDWTPTANTSAGVQAGTWLRELAQLGPSATTTMGQAQVIAEIQNGNAAQSYLVAAAAAQLENPANSSVAGKIGYAPLPQTPSGEASSATGLWSLAIPAGLPKERAEAALDFITWMTSQKAQTLFAKEGGIPVRGDSYEPSDISGAQQEALQAMKETAENLPQTPTSLRYGFSTEMLNATEPALQNIAAGNTPPKDGMDQIQTALQGIISKAGLPTR